MEPDKILTKICCICKETKTLDSFNNNCTKKDGKQTFCKTCATIKTRESREKNSKYAEKEKIYYEKRKAEKDKLLKKCTKCNKEKSIKRFVCLDKKFENRRDVCKDCEAEQYKQKMLSSETKHCPKCNTIKNKSEFRSDKSRIDGLYGLCKVCKAEQDKNYKINNREKVNEIAKKRRSNPHERIAHNLRSRLWSFVKNKQRKTLTYLKISRDEFIKWLEYQFDDKMNWENYGKYWHIDHIIPCSSFDLTIEKNIEICFNWKNLRPLYGPDNMSKNDKIIPEEIENHKKIVQKYIQKYNIIEIDFSSESSSKSNIESDNELITDSDGEKVLIV